MRIKIIGSKFLQGAIFNEGLRCVNGEINGRYVEHAVPKEELGCDGGWEV